MKRICGIYKIQSPTGKIYIGQSVNIYARWAYHKSTNSSYSKNILYKSLVKHGIENHIFEIIETCEKTLLNERERFYIELYNSFDTKHGMNLTRGGDSKVIFSESTILKMSLAKKGKPSPAFGRHHSDETKAILREKSKGNKNWLGKNHTIETKEKCRIASTGNKNCVGFKHTAETKEKNRIASTGRRCLESTKELFKKKQTGRKNNVVRSSIYHGVSFTKSKQKWRAVIKINTIQKHIGYFNLEKDAAIAYDNFVIKNIPYKIPLNF